MKKWLFSCLTAWLLSGCSAIVDALKEAAEAQSYTSFDLHFIVTSDPTLYNKEITAADGTKSPFDYEDEDHLLNYVEYLNSNFVAEDRSKILHFQYKSRTRFTEAKMASSDACEQMVITGQEMSNHGSGVIDFPGLFNDCLDAIEDGTEDQNILDKDAVNVVIFDSIDAAGDDVVSSGGNDNDLQPFVRLDYARMYWEIDNCAGECDPDNSGMCDPWDRKSGFEHEMGHAFTLDHVCNDATQGVADPNGDVCTPTNIMSSTNKMPTGVICDDLTEYAGNRGIGFTPEQVAQILGSAEELPFAGEYLLSE